MKRVLKGNGEHTKIQQKRKFPMKRVLKAQYTKGERGRLRRFPMKRVLKVTQGHGEEGPGTNVVPHEKGVENCLDNQPGSMG
jgi:hypothetical protein